VQSCFVDVPNVEGKLTADFGRTEIFSRNAFGTFLHWCDGARRDRNRARGTRFELAMLLRNGRFRRAQASSDQTEPTIFTQS
jgi:hypothetical protein